MNRMLLLAAALVAAPAVFAHEMPHAKPGSAEFERMKKLVGTWSGTNSMDGKEENVTVRYRLTSGGNAIEETLWPGGPQEMVTVYYDDGGALAMTHYCALGNRPRMKLKSSGPNEIALDFWKAEDFDPAKDSHMHALTLIMPDANHLEQRWTSYEGGKPGSVAVFKFTRKKD